MANDLIGPILVIALVFLLNYGANFFDSKHESNKSKIEIDRIQAETRKEEVDVEKRRLEVEMGKLALEAKRLEHKPSSSIEDVEDAQFTIIDDTKKQA